MSGQSLPPAQSAQEALGRATPAADSSALEPTVAPDSTMLLAVPMKTLGGRLPVQLGLTVGGYYDDNIYLRAPAQAKIEDFIWSLSPLIAWNSAAQTGATHSVQLAYAPTLVLYQDHRSDDTVDEAANAVYAYEGDRAQLLISEAFSEFQEDNADVTDLVTETSSITTMNLRYQLTGKTNLALTARQTYTSDDPGFASTEWTLSAYDDYSASAKVSVGLGGLIGTVDLDGPNQTYEQLNGRMSYDPDPKLSFSVTGGLELRETQSHGGAVLNPDFTVNVAYMPFDGTNLGLTAYRRYEYSNRLFAEDYLATGVLASVSQRFLHRFFFIVSGVFEDADYQDNRVLGSALWSVYFFGGWLVLARYWWRADGKTEDLIHASGLLQAQVAIGLLAMVDFPLQIASIQLEVAVLLGLAWSSGRWPRTHRAG